MPESKEFHGETPEPSSIVMLQLTPAEFLYVQYMMAYAQSHLRQDLHTLLRVGLLLVDSEIFQDSEKHGALIDKLNAYAMATFRKEDYKFYDPATGKSL